MPDTVAPVSVATPSPSANANGWNSGGVTLTFNASDNPGGWGVALVNYALAGAQAGTGSVPPGGTLAIASEGVTTITYFATDIAGNSEAPHSLLG